MLWVSERPVTGSATDPLLGAVLEGRFRVERMLGEGGMGRVYAAEEIRLRRRCALKVLLPEAMADPVCIERFLREAQAIAQLRHENIVAIYHLGDDPEHGVVFFAMELLAGEDLATRLFDRERRPIAWTDIVRWGAAIAGAMATVHAAGLIHRDLKPSNVFLIRRRDGRDQVKLLDFGIARPVQQAAALTTTNATIGTPYYMSPEQILCEPIDHRTDIYSFGVLLFEALAGRPPFVGEAMQVALQHCNATAPQLASLAPDVPYELATLVMRMMAKAPIARPQSMDEIEAVLRALLPVEAATTIPGRAPSQPEPVAPSLAPTLVFHGSRISRVQPSPSPAPVPERRWLAPALIGVTACATLITIGMLVGDEPPPSPIAVTGPVVPREPAAPPTPPPPEPQPTRPEPPRAEPPRAEPPRAEPPPATEPPPAEAPREPGKVTKKPIDPLKSIARAATVCRRQHGAEGAPKIVVDYAVAGDGTVTRAEPSISDALGECLADAVKRARFPPEFKLGQKIEL